MVIPFTEMGKIRKGRNFGFVPTKLRMPMNNSSEDMTEPVLLWSSREKRLRDKYGKQYHTDSSYSQETR